MKKCDMFVQANANENIESIETSFQLANIVH